MGEGGRTRAGERPRVAAPGPIPVHVPVQGRVARRAPWLPSGGPLCVLCVHPLREGEGAQGERKPLMARGAKDRVLSGMRPSGRGQLGYPLLQSADILMYKPRWVPVGIDQAPHVELTREVARRFNNTFGDVFPEPDVKLTEIPKVPGTDGRKMSKSYNNTIDLADDAETITRKVRPMVTDPARKRRTDPGNPEICPVFDLHKIFTPIADREACATGCRTAGIGCLDCKEVLLKHMLPPLSAIRERRQKFAEKPAAIIEILHEGSRRARKVAQATMEGVRAALRLTP